jgi:hypothetical protein
MRQYEGARELLGIVRVFRVNTAQRTAASPWCLLYATNVAGLRLNGQVQP